MGDMTPDEEDPSKVYINDEKKNKDLVVVIITSSLPSKFCKDTFTSISWRLVNL